MKMMSKLFKYGLLTIALRTSVNKTLIIRNHVSSCEIKKKKKNLSKLIDKR